MDSEFVVSTYVHEGIKYELIIPSTDIELIKSGTIPEVVTQPRVRISKAD